MLSNLEMFKEEIYSHPSYSLLSCTQLFGLECGFLKDRMSIVLNNAMQKYVFNIEHELKRVHAPSWRSIALLMSSSDELGAQFTWIHSDDPHICVVVDGQMIDERHRIFHYCEGYSLMSIS